MKPTWIIHIINNEVCECCGKGDREKFMERNHAEPSIFPAFLNMHTHGLEVYNQRNICTTIDVGVNEIGRLINAIGLMVAEDKHAPFDAGEYMDILENGMPVEFMEFEEDPTLYMIIPDPEGRLPIPIEDGIDESVCDFPYSRQRVYAKMIHDDKGYI